MHWRLSNAATKEKFKKIEDILYKLKQLNFLLSTYTGPVEGFKSPSDSLNSLLEMCGLSESD